MSTSKRTYSLRWVAAHGASLVLATVALVQVYAASTGSLSAWKGGGFGMFSTIDSPGSRFVRVYLHIGGEAVIVRTPARLLALEREIRASPSPARLRELGQRLSAGRWIRAELLPASERYQQLWNRYQRRGGDDTGSGAAKATASPPAVYRIVEDPDGIGEPVVVGRVDVEVWQLGFDRPQARLFAAPIQSVSVRVHDNGSQ